jgi:putative tricarboxylic transport membrane protein
VSTSGPRTRELVRAGPVPALFLTLALWISVEALQVPLGTFRMPGAGFFPLALGLTLAALAMMLLAVNFLSPGASQTDAWPERREVLYLIASVVAGAWLFERVGFLLTMAAFLALTMRVLGRISWVTAVVLALVGSVAAYIVFGRVLLIALPSGILPI